MCNSCRISNYDRVVWNVKVYIRIGSYQYIITYFYSTNDHGICTYPNIISNCWGSHIFTPICLTNSYTCGYIDILSKNGIGINYNSPTMTDIETRSYFC